MRTTFLTGVLAGALSTAGIINVSKLWIQEEEIKHPINSQNDPLPVQQKEGTVWYF